jgi:hypothetical protein
MNNNELNEAIPRIYTQFIGERLVAQLLAPKRILARSLYYA